MGTSPLLRNLGTFRSRWVSLSYLNPFPITSHIRCRVQTHAVDTELRIKNWELKPLFRKIIEKKPARLECSPKELATLPLSVSTVEETNQSWESPQFRHSYWAALDWYVSFDYRGVLDDVHLRLLDRRPKHQVVRGQYLLVRVHRAFLHPALLLLQDRWQGSAARASAEGAGQKDERHVVTQQQRSEWDVGRSAHRQSCHFAVRPLRFVVGPVRLHRPHWRFRWQVNAHLQPHTDIFHSLEPHWLQHRLETITTSWKKKTD